MSNQTKLARKKSFYMTTKSFVLIRVDEAMCDFCLLFILSPPYNLPLPPNARIYGGHIFEGMMEILS